MMEMLSARCRIRLLDHTRMITEQKHGRDSSSSQSKLSCNNYESALVTFLIKPLLSGDVCSQGTPKPPLECKRNPNPFLRTLSRHSCGC